jgi:hypothetical protein
MITIVGWLWSANRARVKYTPEHANTWARMIHRHLTVPHRFVLMTDQPASSFDPLIEPVQIWDYWRDLERNTFGWSEGKPQCYVRLRAFAEEAREVFGDRFVSVDLDCLVLDSLDPLFNRTEDFLIYLRTPLRERERKNTYQGSMWMMTAGARRQVFDDFHGEVSIKQAADFIGSDQAWIRHRLGDGEKGWNLADGVFGFPYIKRHGSYTKQPPAGARIVFFHGNDKPWEFVRQPAPAPRCRQCGSRIRLAEGYQLVTTLKPDFAWIEEHYR